MKKRLLFLCLICLIFLTTFNPRLVNNDNNDFFSIFFVKRIEISNNNLVGKDEIKKNLAEIYQKNIFFLRKKNITNKLKKLHLIDSFEIKKIFPNIIKIKIYEEKPIGIINKENTQFIITEKNKLILMNDVSINKNLPNIFGLEAEKNFIEFFKLLNKNNFQVETIKSFYHFKINRWDLELNNNKLIKLPSENVDESIKKALILLNDEKFGKYSILDLRINDKVIAQ